MQSRGIDEKLKSQILSSLQPRLSSENVRYLYTVRIYEGLDLVSKIANENCDNENCDADVREDLYQILSLVKQKNPSILTDFSSNWESLGLMLCANYPEFIPLFPSIEKERQRWTLLDYLQNEIIQFYYSEGKTKETDEAAKTAMNFLLAHRNDDDEKLVAAIENEQGLNSVIRQNFQRAVSICQHNPSKATSPLRACDQSVEITSGLKIKTKREEDMITTKRKPGGTSPGRLKVKRIRTTPGKSSETAKYLNLWLEKDLPNSCGSISYQEPVGGSLAHALYALGTPKSRLLTKTELGFFTYSSINKFQNNLVLAKDIISQPNFNKHEQDGKLLGFPVVGLVGILIVSSWMLRNEDLNLANFGIVYENQKTRFFLFDFDTSNPWDQRLDRQDTLLKALNTGDLNLLKETLKSYIDSCIPETESMLIPILKKLIDSYDEKSVLQELNDLITEQNIFLNAPSKEQKTLLAPEQARSIQHRLDILKASIENFGAVTKKNTGMSKG